MPPASSALSSSPMGATPLEADGATGDEGGGEEGTGEEEATGEATTEGAEGAATEGAEGAAKSDPNPLLGRAGTLASLDSDPPLEARSAAFASLIAFALADLCALPSRSTRFKSVN